MKKQFLFPQRRINIHDLTKLFFRIVKPIPVDVLVPRHPTDRTLNRRSMPVNAINYPFQYANIFTKSRPGELALFIFSKPINSKYSWCVGKIASILDPMIDVIAV